jgi:hypothetical protein
MANRYRDIKQYRTSDGVEYKTNAIYPDIPLSDQDYYVISTGGDRYDTLAQQFYSDHTLWWIIAMANNSERASLIVEPGVQLRIPADKDKIQQLYRDINKSR